MPPATATIQGHTLFRAADISTVDTEKRTFDVIFTTGSKGKRTDFWSGKQWNEELAVDAQSLRLDRLNSGAPLLDTHNQWSGIGGVLGVIERAWIEDGKGMARIRMSARADVQPVLQDLKDGIIRNVSVGYRVNKWEDVTKAGEKIPTMRATDWEPSEVSLVPVGFDPGAQVRGAERAIDTFPMIIISQAAGGGEPQQRSDTLMPPENSENSAPATAPAADTAKIVADAQRAAIEAERTRAVEIRSACDMVRLPATFADKLIKDGTDLNEARALIISEKAKQSDSQPTSTARGVQMGEQDEIKTRMESIENALMFRAFPKETKLEKGRDWAGMTLMEMGRAYLDQIGIPTKGLSRNELAQEILRTRTYHSTSDFPNILANTLRKSLLSGYERLIQQQTFRPFTQVKTTPDFKQVSRVRLGEVPSLDLVPEGAEVTRGTLGESKEVYNLATYGKIFGITRETIINDDLGAFTDIPMKFGAAASRLESDTVWNVITANAAMGDNVALFHATHGNLAGSGAVISVSTLGAGRKAMRTQKGLSNKDFLNIQAKFLVVPAAIETTADQFISQNLLVNTQSNVNPFAGALTKICEPRLDAASTTAWYLFADPATGVDVVELLYLDGATGPQIMTNLGFDVNGVEVKALLDVAAKAIDWRGVYKNGGA